MRGCLHSIFRWQRGSRGWNGTLLRPSEWQCNQVGYILISRRWIYIYKYLLRYIPNDHYPQNSFLHFNSLLTVPRVISRTDLRNCSISVHDSTYKFHISSLLIPLYSHFWIPDIEGIILVCEYRKFRNEFENKSLAWYRETHGLGKIRVYRVDKRAEWLVGSLMKNN